MKKLIILLLIACFFLILNVCDGRREYPTRTHVSDTQDIQDNAITLLSTSVVITDADGDNALYTVPVGRVCILAHAYFVSVGDQGSTTAVSIGGDPAEDDFIPATVLSAIDATDDVAKLEPIMATPAAKIEAYPAGTVIEMQVSSQSGPSTDSTVYLFGFLYDA